MSNDRHRVHKNKNKAKICFNRWNYNIRTVLKTIHLLFSVHIYGYIHVQKYTEQAKAFCLSLPFRRRASNIILLDFQSVSLWSNLSWYLHTQWKLMSALILKIIETLLQEDDCECKLLLLRLPVGRGGVINSPRSIFLGFFLSVSKVGLPLMGVTAVHRCLSHDF